ncbi:hypothetical protein MXF21_17880 [Enterococcus casseliflavus]|uniref:hypothetical protein n=1 Tax=Enterococcus casseliflavus TaxID=37734 RepID=UPI002DBE68E2|nr:hypothetical protein [Enterococcus casseliflavus]MEB6087984.1 hypothetical protein [Enterococcus casseliflavus]
MGFDMQAYNLSEKNRFEKDSECIANFHAFYSDPNIDILTEMLNILPPVKVAGIDLNVEDYDGICSIESIKQAKESFKIEMCKSFEINISTDKDGNRTSEMSDLEYPFKKINLFFDEILENYNSLYIGLDWG